MVPFLQLGKMWTKKNKNSKLKNMFLFLQTIKIKLNKNHLELVKSLKDSFIYP